MWCCTLQSDGPDLVKVSLSCNLGMLQTHTTFGLPAGPGVFSIREPFSFRRNSISLQPYLTAYSNLHSLAILSGEEHLAYTVQNPAEIWKAMPSLSCLRLQGVGLGELAIVLWGFVSPCCARSYFALVGQVRQLASSCSIITGATHAQHLLGRAEQAKHDALQLGRVTTLCSGRTMREVLRCCMTHAWCCCHCVPPHSKLYNATYAQQLVTTVCRVQSARRAPT